MENLYTERIVAFIDILGFKELVRKSEEDENDLSLILEALSVLKNQEVPNSWGLQTIEIEESAQKKDLETFNIGNSVNCTCFSDSLVVSVSFNKEFINEAFSTLIANLSIVGAKLITKGILIRGGLTVGKLIHGDNGIIVGQALIDAYNLENNLAKHPRMIISNELIKRINYPIQEKRNSYPYHQYLKRYDDGCVGFSQLRYFQVLQSWSEYSKEAMKSELRKAKNAIVKGLNSSFENPNIYQKFIWLKNEYKKLKILDDGLKEEIRPIQENTIHYPT